MSHEVLCWLYYCCSNALVIHNETETTATQLTL